MSLFTVNYLLLLWSPKLVRKHVCYMLLAVSPFSWGHVCFMLKLLSSWCITALSLCSLRDCSCSRLVSCHVWRLLHIPDDWLPRSSFMLLLFSCSCSCSFLFQLLVFSTGYCCYFLPADAILYHRLLLIFPPPLLSSLFLATVAALFNCTFCCCFCLSALTVPHIPLNLLVILLSTSFRCSDLLAVAASFCLRFAALFCVLLLPWSASCCYSFLLHLLLLLSYDAVDSFFNLFSCSLSASSFLPTFCITSLICHLLLPFPTT